ncbi:glycosyltransferase [Actinomadura sp. 9N215]|uniref:glycosyltransferase n=1 Tax=Actinomadura sp. 9N215 TaxID=3375150 RepID=UPI00379744F8
MHDRGRRILALKDDLCALSVFATSGYRAELLRSLRSDGIDIDPGVDGSRKLAASAFVEACLEYPRALHRLKDHIDYFEGPSHSAQRAIRSIKELLPSEWFETVSERADYIEALTARLEPGRLDRYFLEAAGKPPPVPPADADALLRALEVLPVSEGGHPLLVLTARAGRPDGPGSSPLLEWAETLAKRMNLPSPAADLSDADDRENTAAGQSRYRGPRQGGGGVRVLAAGVEWSSAGGGVSTFNRQLCIVLAHLGADVSCLVESSTDGERAEAAEYGVRLVTEPDGAPEIIVGHSWITGERARDLARQFPGARRVHFLHMAPEENEWEKRDRPDDAGDRAAARRALEIDLASTAAPAVAVGPRLHVRFRGDLPPAARLIRFDPGFDFVEPAARSAPSGSPWRILVFGRTEDVQLKGLDLAAKAVARTDLYRGERAERIELVVRGARPGGSEKLRDLLRTHSGLPRVRITVRPYTPDAAEIAADLAQASLALLPSRTEGFGMAGLEAICSGTPLLVSGESGLGLLLDEVLPAERAQRSVVAISHDDETDADVWGRAVWAMLRDRDASFARAAELHRTLAGERTWRDAAVTLLAAAGERA